MNTALTVFNKLHLSAVIAMMMWVTVCTVPVLMVISASADNATINFSGKITQAGCTINGAKDLTIPMGDWFATDFSGIGSGTAKQKIPISLNCPSSVQVTATIQADADTQPGTINVISTGSGTAAGGVGIQLVDGSNAPLTLNTAFVVTTSASGSTWSPGWYARYVQISTPVVAGPANATAQVMLSYQ